MKLDFSLENRIITGKVKYPGSSNIISFPVIINNMKELKFSLPFAIPGLEMKGQDFINEETGAIDIKVNRWMFHMI